jgi:hypothetical protein
VATEENSKFLLEGWIAEWNFRTMWSTTRVHNRINLWSSASDISILLLGTWSLIWFERYCNRLRSTETCKGMITFTLTESTEKKAGYLMHRYNYYWYSEDKIYSQSMTEQYSRRYSRKDCGDCRWVLLQNCICIHH